MLSYQDRAAKPAEAVSAWALRITSQSRYIEAAIDRIAACSAERQSIARTEVRLQNAMVPIRTITVQCMPSIVDTALWSMLRGARNGLSMKG